LDRVPPYEGVGSPFEPGWARQSLSPCDFATKSKGLL